MQLLSVTFRCATFNEQLKFQDSHVTPLAIITLLTLQQLREDAIKIRNKKKIEEILEQYPGIHPKLLFKNISDDPELQSKNWFLQLFLDKVQMLAKLILINLNSAKNI